MSKPVKKHSDRPTGKPAHSLTSFLSKVVLSKVVLLPRLFVPLLAVLFFGCAPPQYKAPLESAMGAGRYGDAYRVLKGVCDRSPESPACQEIVSVRTLYAKKRLQELGTSFEDARRPVPYSSIDKFRSELSEIGSLDKSVRTATMSTTFDNEAVKTKAVVAQSLKKAEKALVENDKKAVFDYLKIASYLDAVNKPRFDEFKMRTSIEAYTLGKDAAKKGEWKAAHGAFSLVKHIEQDYKDIDKRLEEAVKKDTYGYHFEEGLRAKKGGDNDKAMGFFRLAKGYKNTKEVRVFIGEIKQVEARDNFKKGEDMALEGMTLSAGVAFIRAIDALREVPKGYRSKVSVPSASIRRHLKELFVLSRSLRDAGNLGQAYLSLDIIYKVQPGYPNVATLRKQLAREIKKRSLQSLGVIPFKGPSYNPDAGNIITSRLLHHLYKELSGDIRILERGAMEALINESEVKTLQGGGNVSRGLLDILGADYMLLGDVVDYKIERQVLETFKTVRARIDTEKKLNPDYVEWKKRKKGDPPQRFIEIPVFEKIKYKTSLHKKTLTATAGYRLVDASGDIVHTGMVERKDEFEDESSEGVEIGDFEVKAKVAKLPGDSKIYRKAEVEIIKKIGSDLKEIFSNPEKKLLKKARRHKEDGEFADAIESFVKASFLTMGPDNKPDAGVVDELYDVVYEAGL